MRWRIPEDDLIGLLLAVCVGFFAAVGLAGLVSVLIEAALRLWR